MYHNEQRHGKLQSISIHINSDATILSLKKKIANKIDVSVNNQILSLKDLSHEFGGESPITDSQDESPSKAKSPKEESKIERRVSDDPNIMDSKNKSDSELYVAEL